MLFSRTIFHIRRRFLNGSRSPEVEVFWLGVCSPVQFRVPVISFSFKFSSYFHIVAYSTVLENRWFHSATLTAWRRRPSYWLVRWELLIPYQLIYRLALQQPSCCTRSHIYTSTITKLHRMKTYSVYVVHTWTQSARTAARTYSTQTRTDAQTLLHTRSNTPLRCGSAVTIQHSIR